MRLKAPCDVQRTFITNPPGTLVSTNTPTSAHELDQTYDCIIAGAGLAGACAAFVLSQDRHVLLVEPEGFAAGASGAAAGLVNPFMARRARATWRMEEALDALEYLVDEAEANHTYRNNGVLRPARSKKQLGFFEEAADAFPEYAQITSSNEVQERYPNLQAPHGALRITRGGAVDVQAMVTALATKASERGCAFANGWRLDKWDESAATITATLSSSEGTARITTNTLLLCIGQGYTQFDALAALDLRAVKGQTVRIRTSASLAGYPPLSGHGYVVPQDEHTCIVGATYEHDFDDLAPSADQNGYLLEKASKMIPALGDAEVLEMRAGARVSPPGSHLPWVGQLPQHTGVWFFGALGSRGLLTAPLLACKLPRYLHQPKDIPERVRLPERLDMPSDVQ